MTRYVVINHPIHACGNILGNIFHGETSLCRLCANNALLVTVIRGPHCYFAICFRATRVTLLACDTMNMLALWEIILRCSTSN